MEERINDKIDQIEKYVSDLIKYRPNNFEEYILNEEKKAACERYLERIIEAMVDLSYLIIKYKNFESAETDLMAFDILSGKEIIPLDLAEGLKEARKMRNILIHQYGDLDDEIVFKAVNDKITRDANKFIKCIKDILK